MNTARLYIGGMSCIHCQEKIETELAKTDGIAEAKVSYASGTAEITYDESKIALTEIEKVITDLDYRILSGSARTQNRAVYAIVVAVIIVLLYALLQFFGVLNYLAPDSLADSSMSYGMLFVIGLITSVHCIAMCGGINLSQCIPKSEEEVKTGFQTFLPAVLYNLGRVISYTLIGFLLGAIGLIIGGDSQIGVSSVVQGVIKIVAGVLMVVMGVNMLGIVPALRKLNPTVPKFLAKKVQKRKSVSKSPFFVGLLNGIMPCGPLQSMWLVALASGSPVRGALSMLLFSLGTVPLMLGLGSIVAKLGQKFTKAVMNAGSVLVVVLGLAMLSQGENLTGCFPQQILSTAVVTLLCVGVLLSLPVGKARYKIASRVGAVCLVCVVGVVWSVQYFGAYGAYDIAIVQDGKQTVTSTLEAGSYPSISVQNGIPVEWVIEAPEGSINGCNYKILIPEYGIEYVFHTGENKIEFVPTQTGSFSYSCWMGMIYGTIVVT